MKEVNSKINTNSFIEKENENKHQIISPLSDTVIPEMCNYMDTKEAEKTVNNNKYLLDNIYSEYFLKNRNEIYIKEEIQILDSNDYIDDNYSTITKKNENKNKLIVNGLVCEHEKWTEKYPDYLKFNCENFGVNEDLIIKNALYDNCKTEHINSKIINNYQNTILSESDDWYYLNVANTLKVFNGNNNLLTLKKKIKLNSSILKKKVINEQMKRKLKLTVKKRRNKRNNKEKSILSKEGIKLQSKIVKKKIKTSEIDIENFNNEIYLTNGENLNNMPYVKNTNVEFTLDVKESTRDLSSKVEQVCIIKEEAILPDYYVVDTIENLKHNIISNEIALLKADYRGDDIQKNLDGKNKLIFSKRENLINYYKEKRFRKPKIVQKCSMCGKEYKRIGPFKRHQKKCDMIRTVIYFECVMCPFKTKNKNAFRNHLGKHILGEAYKNKNHNQIQENNKFKFTKNNTPSKQFCPPSYLKAHCMACNVEMTAVERTSNCKKCLGKFMYWCIMCHKDYFTYSRLRRHVIESLKVSTLLQCSKCGKRSYTSVCRLRRHEMFCHVKPIKQNQKLPYVQLFRINAQILQHVKGPWKTIQTHCPKCNTMRIVLEKMGTCEKCNSLLLYNCELCNEMSLTYSDLRTHIFKAHIIDSYKSAECNEKCYNSNNKSNRKSTSTIINKEDLNKSKILT